MKKQVLLCIALSLYSSNLMYGMLSYFQKKDTTDYFRLLKDEFDKENNLAFRERNTFFYKIFFPEEFIFPLSKEQWDKEANKHYFFKNKALGPALEGTTARCSYEEIYVSFEYIEKRLLPYIGSTGFPYTYTRGNGAVQISNSIKSRWYNGWLLPFILKDKKEINKERRTYKGTVPTISEKKIWPRLLLLALCCYYRKPLWQLGKASLNYIKNKLGYS